MSTATLSTAKESTISSAGEATIMATAPGEIRVIRRNGKLTAYNDDKIKVAMTKAFLAVEGGTAAASSRIHDLVTTLTQQITAAFHRRMPSGGTIHIEDIQDQVELALMRTQEHRVARAYVLYREERRQQRFAEEGAKGDLTTADASPTIQIQMPNGDTTALDQSWLTTVVTEACAGLKHVESDAIITEIYKNLFDGATLADVNKAMIMVARTLIEQEPNYSFVASRLLLNELRSEALSFLKLADSATLSEMQQCYPDYFSTYLTKGIESELLDTRLRDFDWPQLAAALKPERDLQFTYLGLQTLYDRYFLHSEDRRFELPQAFFMRVAMGLALEEDDKNARAIEFYNLLSSFDFMSSTPTLFNSGTLRSQLSSCFLTTVPDDLSGIYGAIKDNALLSKYAGGLGNDWTYVRGMKSHIKGTNGKSQGVVPFLNVANATTVAVNQGGKRKGATCAYLESWHIDVREFLELRKNTGDERRRTHDMNTANWVPDLFMKRVFEKGQWTLFSPDETPDLHDLFGVEFEQAYVAYEAKAARGEIRNFETISAVSLWRKMLSLLFETGHPWITFKDPCNLRSPQQHVGVVHSSNLCTEITLNTSADEIAVCNLGSINLPAHIEGKTLDHERLQRTIKTAMRMLDNVIDINFYSVPQAKQANMRHRPVGMGIMGFQDCLYKLGIAYASDEAVEFADSSMEAVSYYAIAASSDLAQQRGKYLSYEGSLWSRGILPIDSIELLIKARGKDLVQQDSSQRLDWDALRAKISKQGMRNSNVLAIAPTATISNICGVTQSIEPTYQNLYVKSNLSGEFTVVNPYLVAELKAAGLWDEVMANDLKYFNGSVQNIERIPAAIKQRYATAFEVEPTWLLQAASRRQKWIDQSQSLNLYLAQASGKKLDQMYREAWLLGLKTTYYMRSMGATGTEKSTIHDGALNAVKTTTTAPAACAINDPDCEACQ